MLKQKTLLQFIFIAMLSMATLTQKSWADYKDMKKEDILQEVDNDVVKLHEYQPYICYALHEVEASIGVFATKYENYYKPGRNLFRKIWNSIFIDKTLLNKNYYTANFDLKNLFYEFRLLKKDQSEEMNKLDNSDMQLSEDLTGASALADIMKSIDNSDFKGQFNNLNVEDNKFNYYLLGKMFADTLFKDKFLCYDIPELSLLLFRMFHYNLLDAKFLYRFFNGFYDSLYEEIPNYKETKVRNYLMEQFFTYNLQTMLDIEYEMANEFVKMFNHKQSKEEIDNMIHEFSSLYGFILREVKVYTLEHNGSLSSYVKQYHSNPKLFVMNSIKQSGVYVSIFFYRYIKGLLLAPLGPIGGFVVTDALTDVNKDIEKYIEVKLGPDHPDSMRFLKDKSLKKDSFLKSNCLEDYVGIFERNVSKSEACEKCRIVDLAMLYAEFEQKPEIVKTGIKVVL